MGGHRARPCVVRATGAFWQGFTSKAIPPRIDVFTKALTLLVRRAPLIDIATFVLMGAPSAPTPATAAAAFGLGVLVAARSPRTVRAVLTLVLIVVSVGLASLTLSAISWSTVTLTPVVTSTAPPPPPPTFAAGVCVLLGACRGWPIGLALRSATIFVFVFGLALVLVFLHLVDEVRFGGFGT